MHACLCINHVTTLIKHESLYLLSGNTVQEEPQGSWTSSCLALVLLIAEPRINIKLYESVIKPIATNGCAVWGQDFLNYKELFKDKCKTDADKIQEIM